jgi:hypothetical protein
MVAAFLGGLALTSSPALAVGKFVYNKQFEAAFSAALAESNNGGTVTYPIIGPVPFQGEGLAVDDSSSPSAGDIYAVSETVVYKFEVTGSGKSVKVKFLCELGGSNLEASAKPCAATQAPEVLATNDGAVVGPNGEVFVVNTANRELIDEFNSSGAFVRVLSGWSADASTGTSAGVFASLERVGVEPASGDIFVERFDPGTESTVIDKLKPNGTSTPELIQQVPTSDLPAGRISSFAVDSSGNLDVVDVDDADETAVYRFLPEAPPNEGDRFEEVVTTLSGNPIAMAADPTAAAVFFSFHLALDWYSYDPSSTPVGKLTLMEEFFSAQPERPGSPTALAVSSTGALYVADHFPNGIEEFELNLLGGPPAVGPCTASSVTSSGMTLEGTVTPPESHATSYKFEYEARTLDEGPASTLEGPATVETEVGGLTPDTTYHYWVVEAGGSGAHGEEKTVTTGSGATTAKLTGTLTEQVDYYFEYSAGPPPWGNSTTEASAGAGTSAEPVSATLTGLTPETIYNCRVTASAAGGEAEGANGQFMTKPAVEAVTTAAASDITPEGAVLSGTLAPEGAPVEYFFEYGTTPAYGHSTTGETSSSSAEVQASAALSDLQPLTSYHYRLGARRVIEGRTYVTHGGDEVFNTGGTGPEVRAENASNVGPFSAELEATVNPANSATSYYFLYGTSPTSEQAFVPAGAVAGDGSIQVSPETVQNLKPGTVYYYHVVVENSFGKVEGPRGSEEKSFQTLPAHAPDVALAPPGEVTQTTATLSLTLNPQGLPTVYRIYLTIDGSDVLVAAQSAGEGSEPQTSAYVMGGLVAGTTYQVRVLARNQAGEVESQAQSFTTMSSSVFALAQPPTLSLVATPTFAPEKPTTPMIKPKSLTKAQKLAKALKACKSKPKSRHASCERQAREKYAPAIKRHKERTQKS